MASRNFSPIGLFLILIAVAGFLLADTKTILAENATTRTIIIQKINGDATDKWNRVTEQHQETKDGSTHTLTCQDPGNSDYGWTITPRMILVQYAEQQIATGILAGTHMKVHERVVYHVEWEGTDIHNYRIVETQTDNIEPGDGDKYKYQDGTCEGSVAGWWSVTTITDGIPTHITGRDCAGNQYDKDLSSPRLVPDNPVTGYTPTFTGNCEAATWRAVVIYNADQYPAWMGGQACDGTYWVIDRFTEPGAGDSDDDLQ